MGSKSGGGGGAGAMLEYGDKALDLQKQIYDQSREDSQPWLQAGGAGLTELTKRLGLSTSSSPANRESLIKQYTPQFTTNQTITAEKPDIRSWAKANGLEGQLSDASTYGAAQQKYDNAMSIYPSMPTSTTDSAGLNSYVDNLISQQGASDSSDPNYGSLLQNFDMSKYQEDPGYQFRLQQGQQALERKLNASGKTYSPEAAKALIDYNGGSAAQEYGSAYDRFNNDQNNIYNRLAGLSGVGQQASQQLAQQGQNFSNSASDIYTGQGNAITAAAQAKAAGNQSMFNTLLGAGTSLGSAAIFASDRRLKWDISENPVRIESGHNIYSFRYKGDDKKYEGVMADEVLKTHPHAVVEIDTEEGPRYGVNYDVIGVVFKEVSDAA